MTNIFGYITNNVGIIIAYFQYSGKKNLVAGAIFFLL